MLSFWNDSAALVGGWERGGERPGLRVGTIDTAAQSAAQAWAPPLQSRGEACAQASPLPSSGASLSGATEAHAYDTIAPQAPALQRSFAERSSALVQQNFSILFFFLSFILLTFDLLNRWIISQHIPLSNLYESLLFLNWSFIAIFFFFIRNHLRFLVGRLATQRRSLRNALQSLRSAEEPRAVLEPSPPEQGRSPRYALQWRSLRLRAGLVSAESSSASENFSTDHSVLLGSLLSSTVLFIQSFADWRLPDEMKEILPLIPALQSNWLLMHVSIMILSYAALFLGSILAITYVGADWYLENNRESINTENTANVGQSVATLGEAYAQVWAPVAQASPQLSEAPQGAKPTSLRETAKPTAYASFRKTLATKSLSEVALLQLDSLRYRILAFAFPLLTLGILSGAIWANEAWGSYWSWDPKETWAFITWLIFAFYLHTRLQYNWQGTKSAFVASFGFFIVWICYLGVNLLGQGLHSYGWLH